MRGEPHRDQGRHRGRRGVALLGVALLLALLPLEVLPVELGGIRSQPASAAVACGPGPSNLGFEAGVLDGSPECWNVVSAADSVVVTDTQGGADSPTYAEGNIVVQPYRGELMARLGRPKQIAEKQPIGANRIEQTFTPQSPSLALAFWFFSWEHRGNDRFLLDLQNGAGASVGSLTPFTVTMPDGSTRGCSALPCSFSFDVGKRQQFLNSGWVEVDIDGIPLDAGDVKLVYSLSGTDNNAHATWVYADRRQSPPVANFTFRPGDPTDPGDEAPRHEGSPIQLVDRSTDPDDDIVAWQWAISGPGLTAPLISTAREPLFIPPDQGAYDVVLTVTDATGLTSTAGSGTGGPGTADDGATVPVLAAENAPPLVNAVDVEVLPGGDAPLLGRFSDAGWLDAHTLGWQLGGASPIAIIAGEDHLPALATGLVTGTGTGLPATGEVEGTLSIDDLQGGTHSDDFTVSVVPNDPGRFEPNNTVAEVAGSSLAVDGSYLSHIQAAGDVDLFPIAWPGFDALPLGTEVLVTLEDLPADLDVVAFTRTAATAPYQLSPFQLSPYQLSPYQLSPYQLSPYQLSPVQRAPYQLSPYQLSPYQLSPYQLSPYQLSPFQLSPYQLSPYQLSPLSQVGFTGLDAEEIGGTDIDVTELGLGSLIEAGFRVAAFSANRSLDEETLLVRIAEPGTELILAVAGYAGAQSQAPYRLRVEGSMSLDSFALETNLIDLQDVCVPRDPVAIGSQQTLHDPAGPPQTLVITQRELLEATYGAGAVAELLSSVAAFADHGNVQARVVSVGGPGASAAYGAWHQNPCDVGAANDVAASVREAVLAEKSQHPTISTVIVVGSDDIVPSFRLPDDTSFANERYYLNTSFLRPGTPLFAAKQLGHNTSDDCFGDLALSPWQGRFTCIPDLAVGRVLETPAQMGRAFDAFVAGDGLLRADSAFVSAHDFQADLGEDIAATAAAAGSQVDALISETWTADDIRCRLLQDGDSCGPGAGVNSVLAHGLHFAILAANGYTNGDPLDVLTSTEVAFAQVEQDGTFASPLQGALFFTMACQVGFSVPNGSALAVDPGLGIDPNLDMPEAFANAGAGIVLANSGFGIGDDLKLAGSERLLSLFSQRLFAGQGSVGEAVVAAKQGYATELTAMTSIDEKILVQLFLFGIPNYRVSLAGPAASPAAANVSAAADAALTVEGIPGLASPIDLHRIDRAEGSFYTANGDAETTIGRPIVPRVVHRTTKGPGAAVAHGVLLRNGPGGVAATYDEEAGFDPIIGRETTEWESPGPTPEPQVCFDSFWHSRLAHVNALETDDGVEQSIVITPGQFRCTTEGGQQVLGLFRLYDYLNFEVLESTSSDVIPPTALDVDVRPGEVPNTTEIDLVLQDDETGVARVVALRVGGGEVVSFEPISPPPPYATGDDATTVTVTVGDVAEEDRIVVQVADGAGNVTNVTAKAAQLRPIFVEIAPSDTIIPGEISFAVTIFGFDLLEDPIAYVFDFGDGAFTDGIIGPGDVTVDAQGNATLNEPLTHVYAEDVADRVTVKVEITDGFGARGVDEVELSRPCDDAGDALAGNADLYVCRTANDATSLRITIELAEGGVISPDYQYRVRLDVGALDGTPDFQFRYRAGKVTGANSLVVNAGPSHLEFVVALAEIGMSAGGPVAWQALTQAGVPRAPEAGILDVAPNAGFIHYDIDI